MNHLFLRYKRISGNLIISYMGTQVQECFITAFKGFEMLHSLDLHIELPAGIHGESVNHHFRELAVVKICHPC